MPPVPNASFTLIESILLFTKSVALANARVVRGIPTLVLLRRTRLISAPVLKVWPPLIMVRLSIPEIVVPTSKSSWLALRSVKPGTLETPTGALPITGWRKAERFMPIFASLMTRGEKMCCNWITRLDGRIASVSRDPTLSNGLLMKASSML